MNERSPNYRCLRCGKWLRDDEVMCFPGGRGMYHDAARFDSDGLAIPEPCGPVNRVETDTPEKATETPEDTRCRREGQGDVRKHAAQPERRKTALEKGMTP